MSAPDPNAAAVMDAVDGMTPPFQKLVHEFGAAIVSQMIAEGYSDAADLRDVLIGWRTRRQEQWLSTDYITRRSARSLVDAILYRRSLAGLA